MASEQGNLAITPLLPDTPEISEVSSKISEGLSPVHQEQKENPTDISAVPDSSPTSFAGQGIEEKPEKAGYFGPGEGPPLPAPENPLRILQTLADHPDFPQMKQADYFSTEIGAIHSPLVLPDMERAVAYLKFAIQNHHHILVLGDRDVDGVSSTALLGNFLGQVHRSNGGGELTLKVSDDGDDYGLTGGIFEDIRRTRAELVILLDMGTSNGPEINALVETGARVIVLDHHQLHTRIPDNSSCAFVNPMRLPEADRLEHEGKIATVGLVFKLLLGYALSYTKDWNSLYFFPIYDLLSETTRRHNPPGKTEGFLFRLGQFLGRYPNLEAARSDYIAKQGQKPLSIARDNPYSDFCCLPVNPVEHPIFKLSEHEKNRLLHDPVDGGKTLLSLQIRARTRLAEFVMEIAELASVGIITDMVPLVGENRAVVKMGTGLAGFKDRRGEREHGIGYGALIGALKLPPDRILSRDLGWSIGPSLNAAGRMGQTSLALNLLTAPDEITAGKLARDLVKLNHDRKERTKRNEQIVQDYFAEYPEKTKSPLIFCWHPSLEPGVSGIVATRLTERYQKPAVYINPDGDVAKGSSRTWEGMNMLELLDGASELFLQFGGHAEAAGFSLEYDKIPLLEEALQNQARRLLEARNVGNDPATPEQEKYHLELAPHHLTLNLLNELEWMEPFGAGNPEPRIKLSSVLMRRAFYMSEGKHIKFSVQGAPENLEFVAWGKGPQFKSLPGRTPLNIIGCVDLNIFRGKTSVQFRVESVELA